MTTITLEHLQEVRKLHGRAQFLAKGIDPMIRCSALRMREFRN